MQTLRKQTILSSIFMIAGFAFGGLTVLLYTKYGALTKAQVGLTKIIVDFSNLAVAFSTLGLTQVLYKFYPYYNDNLPKKKNELLTLTVIGSIIGFALLCLIGYFIKPLVIKKYNTNSPLIVDYYPYLYVFALGMTLFVVFETLAYVKHKSVIVNFLKETALRFITVVLLLLFLNKILITTFDSFVVCYSLQFILLFLILYIYLNQRGDIYFYFKITRVTKKFWKKMLSMQMLVYSGLLIITIAQVIDVFTLGAKKGQDVVGDFTLAQYGANLVNIPSKAMIGGSIGILTRAWKDKNFTEINRIYTRSCINLSLMAMFLFGNIWLNVLPMIDILGIDPTWKVGVNAMFFFCIARTIEASTGVNNLIILTSTFWKFEFITGIILLAVRMPTTLYFIGKFGLLGATYADIISITIYNIIRFQYLRRRFNMQPYNYKNVLAIILAVVCYFIAFSTCKSYTNFTGIVLRFLIFSITYIAGIFALKLTPDAQQLFDKWVLKK